MRFIDYNKLFRFSMVCTCECMCVIAVFVLARRLGVSFWYTICRPAAPVGTVSGGE